MEGAEEGAVAEVAQPVVFRTCSLLLSCSFLRSRNTFLPFPISGKPLVRFYFSSLSLSLMGFCGEKHQIHPIMVTHLAEGRGQAGLAVVEVHRAAAEVVVERLLFFQLEA